MGAAKCTPLKVSPNQSTANVQRPEEKEGRGYSVRRGRSLGVCVGQLLFRGPSWKMASSGQCILSIRSEAGSRARNPTSAVRCGSVPKLGKPLILVLIGESRVFSFCFSGWDGGEVRGEDVASSRTLYQ